MTIHRPDFAAEAMAGLAAVAQLQGNSQNVLTLVEALVEQLVEQSTIGLDEPFFLCFTCYQVLITVHVPHANSLLQQGHRVLQQYADQIGDDVLRCSFLENVPVHAALHQVFSMDSTTWTYDMVGSAIGTSGIGY